jgi:hypothetical protein
MSCGCANPNNANIPTYGTPGSSYGTPGSSYGIPSSSATGSDDYTGTGGLGGVCNRCLLFWLILGGVALLVLQEMQRKR